MQNRHMTGEEKNPKTRDEWREANGGIPLLTDLCMAMRSDPVGMIRGLKEVVTFFTDQRLRTPFRILWWRHTAVQWYT